MQLAFIKDAADGKIADISKSLEETTYVPAMSDVLKDHITFLSSLIASCDECLDNGYNQVIKLNGYE